MSKNSSVWGHITLVEIIVVFTTTKLELLGPWHSANLGYRQLMSFTCFGINNPALTHCRALVKNTLCQINWSIDWEVDNPTYRYVFLTTPACPVFCPTEVTVHRSQTRGSQNRDTKNVPVSLISLSADPSTFTRASPTGRGPRLGWKKKSWLLSRPRMVLLHCLRKAEWHECQ